jgi:hypothetical protein
MIIQTPGRYFAVLQGDDNHEEVIGEFYCGLVEPRRSYWSESPLLIGSKGRKGRACNAWVQLLAKHHVYAPLERDPQSEAQGFTWYADVPERFVCECGKAQLLRLNDHESDPLSGF